VIQEQFSPLIGFEFKTKNEMNFSFDYGKRRALSLGFISNELAEDRSTTVDIGFGYKLKNIELKFMPGYKKKRKNQKKSNDPDAQADDSGGGPIEGNDLEILFDLGFTDNITLNHYLDQETPPQPTRGSKDFTISPSIRYDINKNVNLRFFFDYRRSIPYTTTGFPTTTSNGGVTVQIVLD
jgi:cell surface protein SprA